MIKATMIFTAMACALIASSVSLCATPLPKLPSGNQSKRPKPPAYYWYEHMEWTNEVWTGNDKPYQIIRNQINAVFARSPQSGQALLAKYAADHKAHPASPTILFRWAFTSLKLAPPYSALGNDGLDAVRDAFAKPPSPHAYNYTRLRYLLYQYARPDPNFLKIGARLLKYQPVDFPVQFYYAATLIYSSNLTGVQEGITEVQKLIQQQPKRISLYALEGTGYHRVWWYNKNKNLPVKAAGDSCIAAYQEYLSRAPANDPFRKSAEDMIDLIKTR